MITPPRARHFECEVKWALESITKDKASGGNGIPAELFQILKDDAVKVLHSICQQTWETQQWQQDWKRSVFILIPKKGNPKECSNYRTVALIAHASKVMLKIVQARLQQYLNLKYVNFQMFKLVLENAKEPEIKLLTSTGLSKKQESSRKTSVSALLIRPKPLTVWISTSCGKYLIGISDHLTCLLRNLYTGQEATVRTGHGTTDWFQIGKGVW